MIKLEHIDKYFNRHKKNEIHVINNTSIEFEDTGLVALLGPSGSGKTTLLNVIGGLDNVRKGKIYVNDQKITGRLQTTVDKIRNLNIGYIFQDYKLIETESVYDNISLVLKMIGIKDKKEIDKRVCYVLEKVGMLRYKKRPCNMLSGGERQRVGIARAIVKNPNVIIADEPTGNLDSKNSIEIMNIIKAISKDKLVILVTHEANLAKFYASRIIELEDGKIIKDYQNENTNDLDYETSSTLYLKDYKYLYKYDEQFKLYSNEKNDIKVNIVVTDHNIYIQPLDNRKIEIIDDNSSMEMLDEHRKRLSKEDIDKYQFNYQEIINNPKKLKYSSIFNPITFITNGFKKVLDYSVLKKILLIGFFLSGIYIMYATSSIASTLTVKDSDFIKIHKDYVLIESQKLNIDDYLNYEANLSAEYIIPTDSEITMNIKANDFYQTSQYAVSIKGSIASFELLKENDLLLYGTYNTEERSVMVDELVIKQALKNENNKMLGFIKEEDFLNRKITIPDMGEYTIVGIVQTGSPAIYVQRNQIIPILYHDRGDAETYQMDMEEQPSTSLDDFVLYTNKVTLKEGRWPTNDYEVVVNYNEKETMKLNKEINKTIHNRHLVVVGYYTSKDDIKTYLVNGTMIKYQLITKSKKIAVYTKNKEQTINIGREQYNLNIKDSYTSSKEKYLKEQKPKTQTALVTAGIIIAISLIEILLMIRSSFLSRIKEVGVYRAIGVKKKDIYIMFSGEIIAITTFASVPAILITSYIIYLINQMPLVSDNKMVLNPQLILMTILIVYLFNLIIGLFPVYKTMRKRPAQILSRIDI